MFKYLLLFCLARVSLCDELKQPDFAVILPENQDVWDGMFVTPPLCCPSRENALTGDTLTKNKNLNGDYYGSNWMHNENSTFARLLTEAGYIFYAGKYQGCYPKFDSTAMDEKSTHTGAFATLLSGEKDILYL